MSDPRPRRWPHAEGGGAGGDGGGGGDADSQEQIRKLKLQVGARTTWSMACPYCFLPRLNSSSGSPLSAPGSATFLGVDSVPDNL